MHEAIGSRTRSPLAEASAGAPRRFDG